MDNIERVRAFIALDISSDIKEKLSNLQKSLKDTDIKIRWVAPENIHITLKFLGNVEGNKISKIKNVLREVVEENEAFIIKFTGIGAFPHLHNPRVIWVGIEEGEAGLKKINQKIEEGLKKIKIKREGKEFQPHLTIGRMKSSFNKKIMIDLINKYKDEKWGEIVAEKITLYKSTLTAKGPVYSPLSVYYLKNIKEENL